MPFALLSEYKRRTPHIIYGGTDMKLFITFSKRSLAAVLLALIAALAVLSRVTALSGGDIGGATNAERVDYMNSLGCNVEETAVSFKKTVIPKSFGSVYKNYNSLQRKAGFDLEPYRGREALVYTYRLTDVQGTAVNLIVVDGCIVGGDISSTALDGFMLPLLSESVKKIET